MGQQILKTRLYKPQINGKLIERKQLIEKLDAGKDKSLSLVIAPTGYGKSVIISSWLEKTNTKYCWITLDEELNDFSRFLSHMVYGIEMHFEGEFDRIQEILSENDIASFETIASLLINKLDEIDEELIIILDDYHWIRNQKINDLIHKILKYPPEKLHVIIISRWDPTLQLGSQRTFGLVNDIRQADLSFDLSEVMEFAGDMLNEALSEDDCKFLLDKTEGWIAGLKLALCDLKGCNGILKPINKLEINYQYFRDYVLDQLFERQSEHAKNILIASAIAPWFCKDLLCEVLDSSDEELPQFDFDTFEHVVKTWQFVIPLDNQGEWYRFHQIIHDFLVSRLKQTFTKETIRKLHRRVSLFFERQGQMEIAIKQAVSAEDIDLIADLFERNKYAYFNNEKSKQVCQWVELIPGTWIEQHPELLLTRTFLHEQNNDFVAMQRDFATCELLLSSIKKTNVHLNRYWGEYYNCLAIISYTSGNSDLAIESAKKALRLLKAFPGFIKNIALYYLAIAFQVKGQASKALKLIDKYLESFPKSDNKSHIQVLTIRAVVCAMEGDLNMLNTSASKLKAYSKKHKLQASYIRANYFLFSLHYRQNKLSEAINLVNDFDDHIYFGWSFMILNYLFLKGFAYNAQGEFLGYNQTLNQINEFANAVEHENMVPLINAFKAEIALMHGDYDKALKISQEADFEPYEPFGYYYIPQLTKVRLSIYSGHREQQNEALEVLDDLIEKGRARHLHNLLAKALPLKAVLLHILGKYEMANLALEEAVCISRPHGYIRNFLDLGKLMHSMINTCLRKRPDDLFLISIEKAFNPDIEICHTFENLQCADTVKPGADLKLSKRETEILELLFLGYQNKEIANKLFVTNEAVKKSLYRLYQKLEVNNRSNAILTALKLGVVAHKEVVN
ncbi:LuxR C-terminal-related transcriptional regulator [Carboxylicivirga taeanensis]|uniref:LuxR C-terminal-related transcriptional regulator n=1 Tax=Carboxylicivirga taeanensis TaxID=1416875 RepID=UPI003F6E0A2B